MTAQSSEPPRVPAQAYLRTTFLERIAHELRGPAGVTAGALDEIERARRHRLSPERAVAAARADFERSREDYRHGRQQDITDVNKKIADLEAKQKTATGKERATLDSNLPALRARRDTLAADLQRLDDATPASWDGARASLDKEWDALKTALDEVS